MRRRRMRRKVVVRGSVEIMYMCAWQLIRKTGKLLDG